jgi:hypothetical protein
VNSPRGVSTSSALSLWSGAKPAEVSEIPVQSFGGLLIDVAVLYERRKSLRDIKPGSGIQLMLVYPNKFFGRAPELFTRDLGSELLPNYSNVGGLNGLMNDKKQQCFVKVGNIGTLTHRDELA